MAKMKRIPLSEFEVGMQVVVSDQPDTYVYTVSRVNGQAVSVEYTMANGSKVQVGTLHYSLFYRPTQEQLACWEGK